MYLSLRELEALAGALLSILLTFLDARVARHQARLLQRRTKISIVLKQRAGDAMANCACLARRSATANVDQNIKFGRGLGQLQRLPDDHAQRFVGKILVE